MGAPVVITGGSSGIGRAIEVRLRSAGYQTLNLDIVPSTDDTLDYIHCDLNDPEQIASAIDHLPREIAGLICVAGVGSSDDPAKIVRINFLGTRCLTDSLMSRVRAGSGITLIASSAGRD
ncbi:MAG: SDR family NAD(P)-dependent oxidoreductase, partial [Gammaproteobacteria bacterium]